MNNAGNNPPHRGGARGWIITIGILIGLIVIGGVAYGIDVALNQGKIPRGTTVGGVDISSLERDAAVTKLQHQLGGVENKPVLVHAGEKTSQLLPKQAGLHMDFQHLVANIAPPSLNPIARVASFFAQPTEIPVASAIAVDTAALQPQLDRVRAELHTEPKDGGILVEPAGLKVIDPIQGQDVAPETLRKAVQEGWLNPDGIKVSTVAIEPAINSAVIKNMLDGEAKTAFGRNIVVNSNSAVKATLGRDLIAQFVTISNKGGRLVLNVDTPKAQGLIAAQLKSTEIEAQNAKIAFNGNTRFITPSRDGSVIDWEKTMAGFEKRVVGDDRTWAATYKPQPATFTTEMAEKANFDQVIGEFTTSGFSGPSGENIRLVAQEVNGAIVGPGETFSLNGYTGPRGLKEGFVESGIIINGHAGKAVGGGISQFATTLYNAAYFAGMEDVTHTPHSYYISRYPAGREATVFEGSIDLKFKNTSPFPVRIVTDFGGGAINVKLMGVKTVEVTSTNNGRWAPTQPEVMNVTQDCSPSTGAPGFTTSDTRTIKDLTGKVLSQTTQTTKYDPVPIVHCG